jgi:hypothetical protein
MIPAFDLFDKAISADDVLKGDYVGHPFRGNQWVSANGAGRGIGASSTPDQDKQAYDLRQSGKSWEEIAKELGYANGGSVRRLAMRHEKRLKDGGEVVIPKPVVPKPDLESDSETDTSKVADGLSIKRARRLLQQTFGGDVVGALNKATMNGSQRVDLTAPMTDEEKQIVANMQEAGNLLAAAYKAEISKLGGVDPVKAAELTKEYEGLQFWLTQIGSERHAMYRAVTEPAMKTIIKDHTDEGVAQFGEIAKGLIARFGGLPEPNTNSDEQGYGVYIDRRGSQEGRDQIRIQRGTPEGDVAQIRQAAETSIKRLAKEFSDGKITAEQLNDILSKPDVLAMRLDTQWVSGDNSRTGNWNELGPAGTDNAKRFFHLPYEARVAYHAELVRQAFDDKRVKSKIGMASFTNANAADYEKVAERSRELYKLINGNTDSEKRAAVAQQALNNVLGALGIKTGKAGSVGIVFTTGSGHIRGVGTSMPYEWNEGRFSKHKYDKVMKDNIDNLSRLIPREFIRGTVSSLYSNQMPVPLNYEIEFGARRAHAQNMSKHTKMKLAAPPTSVIKGGITQGGWASTLFHEMGHGIENNNPILRHLQAIYWKSRAGSETIQSMRRITGNTGYRSGEIGVKDNWLQAYAGKIYSSGRIGGNSSAAGSRGQNYEIFTTGLEALAFPNAADRVDADHLAFTLALLASASQVK